MTGHLYQEDAQHFLTSMSQVPQLKLTARKINLIILLLLSLFPLLGMGVDLIAPSLPAIKQSLKITSAISKDLITIYLFGLALGNFFIGFLADTLGRRKLIVSTLLVFAIASLLPLFFPNIAILLLTRFSQGFALGGFAVASRTVFSDILVAEQLIRVAPLIAMTWGIGPIIGPIIGGYLQYYFDWQACFYFFAVYGLLSFIGVFFVIPETHFNRQEFNFIKISNNFISIVSHRVFMGMVALMGITYSLLIVFNTLGPFLIQAELGHTPIYFGRIAAYMGLTFLLGTLFCRLLVKHFESEKILSFAVPIFILIAFVGLILAYFDSKSISLIVGLSLFMFLACGIIYPTGMGKGLSLFRHLAGSGSAVMSLINILMTALMAFFASFINARSAVPLAWVYMGLMLAAGLSYWILVSKRKSKKQLGDAS